MIQCSLCGQQFKEECNSNTEEIMLEAQKVNHENYHLIKLGKQRHSDQKIKRNIKIGTVRWIKV